MKIETKPALPGRPGVARPDGQKHPVGWTALLLAVILAVLFWRAFLPNFVAFGNDDPLGAMAAEQNSMPSIMTGLWQNLNWLGSEGLPPSPSITTALRLVTSPRMFLNLFCPASLFIVGICACFCLRQFNLTPMACILGGLAAGLNSDFLSTASWGVASQTICIGVNYLAVGLLAGSNARRPWIRVILAGMAVGMGVMEGYDVGALFSLFVAAFALCQTLFLTQGEPAKKIGRGVARVALVALFAGFIAVHSLSVLVGTQIKDVSGTQQDEKTKARRWDYATQFSFPTAETLQVMVPGIFGFRNYWHMYENNQPKDDQYWGAIGAGPGMFRLTGTGFYAGVPVVVIALWAILQSFRRRGSPFSELQRRSIRFWFAVMILALLLAFGKSAPLYRLFYSLPYASTIRNPVKFMHVFSWALILIFGYGVHGLTMAYCHNPVLRLQGWLAQFKKWRSGAAPFDQKWMNACFAAIGVSLLAWLIYAAKSSELESYLRTVGFSSKDAPGAAMPGVPAAIVKFSLQAVFWFIALLVMTVGLLALIFSGQFTGPRAKWAGILLGAFLVLDLGRADRFWIVHYDVDYKFASDPIIKFLADKPYEHRVTFLPVPSANQQYALLHNAYGSHWNQHVFPYNNIQSLDMVQEPRVAVDKEAFMQALPLNSMFNFIRLCELSNTRYLLGPGGDFIKQIDPSGKQFRVLKPFNLAPKRSDPTAEPVDWSTVEDPNGQVAVIEFTGALPRAKLFPNWQVTTNDNLVLQTLASPGFDPHQSVFVTDPIPAASPANTNQDAGTVEIKPNYLSKFIELDADVKVPSVLLLTERFNPKWKVWVDGKPETVLRCDFIMRGVYLQPGKHDIVFRYSAPTKTLYVSLAAIALGLILCLWLAFDRTSETTVVPEIVPDLSKAKAGRA